MRIDVNPCYFPGSSFFTVFFCPCGEILHAVGVKLLRQAPPVVSQKNILPFVAPDQAVFPDENIIVKSESLSFRFFRKAEGCLLCIINGVIIDSRNKAVAKAIETGVLK
jgi:hypothetical protein